VSDETAAPVRAGGLRRFVAAPLQFGHDWLARFIALQGFDRAVALAGQAFTALIPLLIVYGSVTSKASGRDFADSLIDRMDLSGAAAASLKQAFTPSAEAQSTISVLGAVILVFSALSFTRALQRLYQLAWSQPSLGMRAAKWGLIWLAIVVVTATLRPLVLGPLHGVAELGLSLAVSTLLWLVTPYVLLGRRVAWARLAPTALLTAIGMGAVSLASAIWMPHSVATSAAEFGTIGIAFALLSWLVCFGMVLVVTAAGGAVIEDYVQHRRGHPPG